jgi:hypothetical protein
VQGFELGHCDHLYDGGSICNVFDPVIAAHIKAIDVVVGGMNVDSPCLLPTIVVGLVKA